MYDFDVIIPIYNEESILEYNLNLLNNFFSKKFGKKKFQFIIIDNGSSDKSNLILNKLKIKFKHIKIFKLKNPNYGMAIKYGIIKSKSKYCFLCDIEQWDFNFFKWSWINKTQFNYFIGSRRSDPTINFSPKLRRFLSWGLNILIQLNFDYMGNDTHGPKFFNRKKILKHVNLTKSDRGQFDVELVLRLIRAGEKIVELPIVHKEYRKPKFAVIKKIIWNIIAFYRLKKIIRKIEYSKNIEFYKFPRSIVEKQKKLII
tara:strand:+ start:715 stop:1488 length:774 start_codon:yes stop_codon:yes gene_type:complete